MILYVDYASPSVLDSNPERDMLGLSANGRRPVRFHGKVRQHAFLLRIALRALGEVIWSNDNWLSQSDILDPIITVHPDRIFFEAFSQDQSTYGCLIVDPDIFQTSGEVITGTTNIDFSAWLWGALGEMRTSRETHFRIGAEGFEVTTQGAGGRFEKKVDIPENWVRGFLQVQAAMGLPGTRLSLKPIDLLNAIRFLRYTKARVSPRALRYEFPPGEDARLVLEPWEQVISLEGAEHSYEEFKSTRVWGRKRLKLIEGLLPFAEAVQVYLKGRALPSFYAVQMPGMTFLLGMTGWSGSAFTSTGGFDLLEAEAGSDSHLVDTALALLRQRFHVSIAELAQQLQVSETVAAQVLVRLCRRGQCMFDVQSRRYRHRELFEQPADEAKYFPPDLRDELARKFLDQKQVQVVSCNVEENTKTAQLKTPEGRISRTIVHRDWRVTGNVANHGPVEVVVSNTGKIIFGRCPCSFFQEHLLNQGPCEHLLALFRASEEQRVDQPSSLPTPGTPSQPIRPNRWEVDGGYETDENEEEENPSP